MSSGAPPPVLPSADYLPFSPARPPPLVPAATSNYPPSLRQPAAPVTDDSEYLAMGIINPNIGT